MKIQKILNNNAVICIGDDGKEIIVMGCGIAFQKRTGDIVPKEKIEKTFLLAENTDKNAISELLSEIPAEYFIAAEKIIALAKNEYQKTLNDSIFVALTDHIYGMSERLEKGILLKCPLLWDIKHLYNDEYEIGMRSLKIMQNELDIDANEDEAGFIALHVINAQLDGVKSSAKDITKLIQEILKIVKYDMMVVYDENTLSYQRFLSHLKSFSELVLEGKESENEDDTIFETVKDSYPRSFKCCQKIRTMIENRYGYRMSHDEQTYITIHIERIARKN